MNNDSRLDKILSKTYEPSSRIDKNFNGKDITMITNEDGEPIRLYLGRRKENGEITGEKFVRKEKLVQGIKKTHWENKGRVS